GAPGVGKSTLVNTLTLHLRNQGFKVGILAVDPSSPFTGGAILGDRIRMQDSVMDTGVFMRSLASRGHLGGLSRATFGALTLLDAAGFDKILIETVGAGQSEVEIMEMAHTTMVVLAPGMGDDIQAIKAGILEIGQVFVVNKADRDGADHTVRSIRSMLALSSEHPDWMPPIIKTVAEDGRGMEEVSQALERHHQYLIEHGLMDRYRWSQTEHVIEQAVSDLGERLIRQARLNSDWAKRVIDVGEGKIDADRVAEQIWHQSVQEE
ncbi:MAG: methylmalonyl Co-A mutase-associated GTPase MeaB, partial [Sulfobacillus sp.]